jgi:hypothetical protein
MASLGLTLEDYGDEEIELWPENIVPVDLFRRMRGSWRVGMNGPYGLDLNVAFALLDLMGVAQGERLEVIDALRVLEQAAIDEMKKGNA